MNWSILKTVKWFKSGNPHTGNLSPDEFYAKKPEKCVKWILSFIEENKK